MGDADALVAVGAVSVMPVTEADVAERVARSWAAGRGGAIVTVNVDIARAVARDPRLARLVQDADVVVADGMPLVWAAAVAGHPLPERVTGASLVGTLAAVAAESGRSIFVVGGPAGVPEAAADALVAHFPGLTVAGTEAPAYGFERDERQVAELVDRVAATRPDLVLVGLGFPKQEELMARLRPALPRAWMLGCGAGVPFAAGQFRRAPELLQRLGAEWLHRLALEPRRLARRYLLHDMPYALRLLTGALGDRLRLRPAPVPEVAGPLVRPIPLPRSPRQSPLPPSERVGA